MGLKRLVLELIAALLLALFAMSIGGVHADESPCAQGLPALAAEAAIPEHNNRVGCAVATGQAAKFGESDGRWR